MVTENWETMDEVRKRTGADAEAVVEYICAGYKARTVDCRFVDRDSGKVIEFKKKESRA